MYLYQKAICCGFKRKEDNDMKRNITRAAALIMAAMLAGSAMPASLCTYAVSGGITASSDESEKAMKEALAIVKKRVEIPAALSEFNYSTREKYGTKSYNFHWFTPDDAEEHQSISVHIVGDIITSYDTNLDKDSDVPFFAKLSDEQLVEKAKEHIRRLDPSIADKIKIELNHISLYSDLAELSFQRYENGVPVLGNNGKISIHKDTGELEDFSVTWMDNAKFADPKTALTGSQIKDTYKKLCTLTPYYKVTTDRKTQKVTARIVYTPDFDFDSEIDAFTGKKSTIWEDMQKAEGTTLSGYDYGSYSYADIEYEQDDLEIDDDVEFTEAELKKIQQDENLLTTDQVFELLKKDKFVALTDDYALHRYNLYSAEDYDLIMYADKGTAVPDKNKKNEHFYMNITFSVKKELWDSYKGYTSVFVQLDAETGEIFYFKKSGSPEGLPKLDLEKAKAQSEYTVKTLAKDIVKEYKADKSNNNPVSVWTVDMGLSKDGQKIEKEYFETERTFYYSRYVNGIEVFDDYIVVTVDSENVITSFDYNHTEAAFPSADDMLTPDEAFESLYKQRKFEYYYDGWIAKDGSAKTYLIYRMDPSYINAKTGRICYWNGEPITERTSSKTKYTDIKGIPQEKAILTLQRYGILLTEGNKFEPAKAVTEEEFCDLIISALSSYTPSYYRIYTEDNEKSPDLTRERAAFIFTQFFDTNGITSIPGIFRSPFSDVKSSSEYAGVIAVANAKGFMNGKDGKFNGSKKITRAEAVQMIYDYILYINKKS